MSSGKYKRTKKHKEKISKGLRKSYQGRSSANKGKKLSKETKEKISEGLKVAYKEGRAHPHIKKGGKMPQETKEKVRKGIIIAYKEGRKTSFFKDKKREKHPNWKGGKHKDNGYVLIYTPDHPSATKSHPYIAEHRLIMEKILGRYLKSKEQVHHKNAKKDDNRPENLAIEVVGHRGKIICPFCEETILIR